MASMNWTLLARKQMSMPRSASPVSRTAVACSVDRRRGTAMGDRVQGASPVEHKDAGRRRDILRAATKLFAEQGYRETNLNQIAVELGFRRQAVYHYFPAKDEILYELIAQAGDAMLSS